MPKPVRRRQDKIYIGVDPGKKGGMAAIAADGIDYTPMPTSERDIWHWFFYYAERRDVFCCLEQVHAFRGQGVTSMFTFGQGYGGLRMALTGCSIPFQTVRPQAWLKTFSVPPRKKTESKAQFKERIRATSQQVFPYLDVWDGTLGDQRAVCDALLIAEHARRIA